MADVQLEHGYTRLANELLEALARAALPSRHMRVLLAMIRLTYGYNRTADRIAIAQVVGLTGVDERSTRRILADLRAARMLDSVGSPGQIQKWSIQKDYEQWTALPEEATPHGRKNPGRDRPGREEPGVSPAPGISRPETPGGNDPKPRVSPAPLQRQKDSSPKTQSPRSRAAAKSPAPDALEGSDLEALEHWTAASCPEQRGRVPALVAECLDHFRGTGKLMANWPATCRNWIRRDLTYRRERGKAGPGPLPMAPSAPLTREDYARIGEQVNERLVARYRR